MNSNYAYLNARVSILASRLFSETRLTEWLNQPLGQPGQQRTGPLTVDDCLIEGPGDTSVIEQTWFTQILNDFEVLVRPLAGGERELLVYWLRKCEITNLKTIIRGKIAGLKTADLSAQLMEVGHFATLPLEHLLGTEDVSELLRQLENGLYGNIVRPARRVFEKEHQLYSLDAAIDRHYLLGLMQRVRALSSSQRQFLLPLFSILMDRFNLLWLLRYRFNYHLSAAETYYLLVPTPYLLNKGRLQHLVEFNTLSEVLAHLPNPLSHWLAETNNIFSVDQRLITEIRRLAMQTLQWRSFTLAKVFAYILLREMEMRRVMAIIKGRRLQLNRHTIITATEHLQI